MRRISVLLAAASIVSALVAVAPARATEATRAVVWEHAGSKHRTEVWIASIDGSGAHKLVRGEQPDISPDGQWVAYTVETNDQYGLFVIPSSGGTPRVVFSDTGSSTPQYTYTFDWSSDSRMLAFGVSGDDTLVATYDVSSGQRGKSIGFLDPAYVVFVPNSNQIVVDVGNSYSSTSFVLMNIDDGSVRPLADLRDREVDRLVVSPTTLAFQAVTGRLSLGVVGVPSLPPLDSKLRELRTVDLGSGGQHLISTAMSPIGWRSDGRTLDAEQSTCSKSRCTFNAVTVDSATGVISQGVSLGQLTVGTHKVRQHRKSQHGKRHLRNRVDVKSDGIAGIRTSTDGASLLGQQYKADVHGSNVFLTLVIATLHPRIVRVPLSGGPLQLIAHGSNPDWNL